MNFLIHCTYFLNLTYLFFSDFFPKETLYTYTIHQRRLNTIKVKEMRAHYNNHREPTSCFSVTITYFSKKNFCNATARYKRGGSLNTQCGWIWRDELKIHVDFYVSIIHILVSYKTILIWSERPCHSHTVLSSIRQDIFTL